MLSSGSGSTGRFFHSFERGVSVEVVDASVAVRVESDESVEGGVSVTDLIVGTVVRICVADGGTSYRGVGINRAGVFVGVDVGIGGVSA